MLTCIVNKYVQPGFSRQKVFNKDANRLETGQIQLHEDHLTVAALLEDIDTPLGGSLKTLFTWNYTNPYLDCADSSIIVGLTLRMSKAAASALLLLRQARITRAPLLAKSKAVALPMPVLLPVQEKWTDIIQLQ